MSVRIIPIRELEEADCTRLDRVMQAARPALAGRTGQLDRMRDRREEARFDPCRWIFAALKDGRPVGFADAEAHYPDLESVTVAQMAVDREERHRGIGRALVQAVVERAEGSGILWVTASTRIRSADGFWTGLGFQASGGGRFRCPVEAWRPQASRA